MENYSFIVGIDVSKSKLDYSIISNTDTSSEVVHFISSNDKKGIKTAVKEIKSKVDCLQDVLFCFENTGVYSMPARPRL